MKPNVEIEYWRERAKVVVFAFQKIKPILDNRRGAFNFQEWQAIKELEKLVEGSEYNTEMMRTFKSKL